MKIGIVNDSQVALHALTLAIREDSELSVAWVALDGAEAVEKCLLDRPDLVLMDLFMPRMDGIEATRRIMQSSPCPVLVVTASVDAHVAEVFQAMGEGALDAIVTPELTQPEARQALRNKIRSIASISGMEVKAAPEEAPVDVSRSAMSCVAIGSSAGGPAALMEILRALPVDLRTGIIVVQHIDSQFAPELANWLDARCSLPVRLAEEGDDLYEGQVLVARGGRHLVFSSAHRLHYTQSPLLPYQPSVDVFFDSALRYGPKRLMGMLLTGMGRDGAKGLQHLRLAGQLTIAQDEESSAIYGMPRAAAEIGAALEILPLSRMADRIVKWSTYLN